MPVTAHERASLRARRLLGMRHFVLRAPRASDGHVFASSTKCSSQKLRHRVELSTPQRTLTVSRPSHSTRSQHLFAVSVGLARAKQRIRLSHSGRAPPHYALPITDLRAGLVATSPTRHAQSPDGSMACGRGRAPGDGEPFLEPCHVAWLHLERRACHVAPRGVGDEDGMPRGTNGCGVRRVGARGHVVWRGAYTGRRAAATRCL